MHIATITTSSMTSREIAELTGKQHASVLRDIRVMLSQINGGSQEDYGTKNILKNQQNTILVHGVSVSQYGINNAGRAAYEYVLDRDNTYCLVAGYDASSRMRIIKRWQELEARQPAIPRTYAEALQLAADQARQIEQQTLQIEAAKPAVEFHERVAVAEDGHAIDEAAKILRVGPNKLRKWMRQVGILRADGLPAAEMMNRGYFRVIEKTIEIGHGFKLYRQSFVTGKGMQFLQRRIDRTLMGVEL